MAWKPKSVPDVLEPGTNEFELVEFWMYDDRGEERYTYIFGVNVAKVKEVVWLPEIIKVPNLPEAIVGVINLRGQVIPLIDLASWMHIREPEDLKRKSVIITEFYKVKIGFIVHEAKRIRRVTWDKIKPPPEVLVAQFGTKITGVIEIGEDKFLLILDLENVLADLGLIAPPEEIEVEKVPEDIKGPVLIADDSSVARKILKDIYTKAGFDQLLVVKDGLEAWNTLNAILEKAKQEGRNVLDYISLVVTDVEMPQMDGYTLTRKIKDHPELSVLPVIINSSLSEESNVEKAERVKADAFFVKFEPEELIKVSKELIYRARKGTLGETYTNIPGGSGIHISKVAEKEEKKTEDLEANKVIKTTNSNSEEKNILEDTDMPEDVDKRELNEQPPENSAIESPADEIDRLISEVQKEKALEENSESEDTAEKEQNEKASEDLSVEDEIDRLIAEVKAECKDKEQENSSCDVVDDIDALIEAYQKQGSLDADESSQSNESGDNDTDEDIVDQILAELESGKMGASGATNEAGAYEVPTAEKLLERDDITQIIEKLEDRLASLTEEDEALRLELVALIENLKKQIEAQKKEKEETRVVAKLYKVTRETEEKTVQLMEIIEKAMDIANECLGIADEVENEEVKAKLTEKLNSINEVLFEAINHLQFQDITRQKIERVIAALKKLNDYLNEWFGTDFIGD